MYIYIFFVSFANMVIHEVLGFIHGIRVEISILIVVVIDVFLFVLIFNFIRPFALNPKIGSG